MVFVKINSHSIKLFNTNLTKLKISLEINHSQITNLKTKGPDYKSGPASNTEVSRDL